MPKYKQFKWTYIEKDGIKVTETTTIKEAGMYVESDTTPPQFDFTSWTTIYRKTLDSVKDTSYNELRREEFVNIPHQKRTQDIFIRCFKLVRWSTSLQTFLCSRPFNDWRFIFNLPYYLCSAGIVVLMSFYLNPLLLPSFAAVLLICLITAKIKGMNHLEMLKITNMVLFTAICPILMTLAIPKIMALALPSTLLAIAHPLILGIMISLPVIFLIIGALKEYWGKGSFMDLFDNPLHQLYTIIWIVMGFGLVKMADGMERCYRACFPERGKVPAALDSSLSDSGTRLSGTLTPTTPPADYTPTPSPTSSPTNTRRNSSAFSFNVSSIISSPTIELQSLNSPEYSPILTQ